MQILFLQFEAEINKKLLGQKQGDLPVTRVEVGNSLAFAFGHLLAVSLEEQAQVVLTRRS